MGFRRGLKKNRKGPSAAPAENPGAAESPEPTEVQEKAIQIQFHGQAFLTRIAQLEDGSVDESCSPERLEKWQNEVHAYDDSVTSAAGYLSILGEKQSFKGLISRKVLSVLEAYNAVKRRLRDPSTPLWQQSQKVQEKLWQHALEASSPDDADLFEKQVAKMKLQEQIASMSMCRQVGRDVCLRTLLTTMFFGRVDSDNGLPKWEVKVPAWRMAHGREYPRVGLRYVISFHQSGAMLVSIKGTKWTCWANLCDNFDIARLRRIDKTGSELLALVINFLCALHDPCALITISHSLGTQHFLEAFRHLQDVVQQKPQFHVLMDGPGRDYHDNNNKQSIPNVIEIHGKDNVVNCHGRPEGGAQDGELCLQFITDQGRILPLWGQILRLWGCLARAPPLFIVLAVLLLILVLAALFRSAPPKSMALAVSMVLGLVAVVAVILWVKHTMRNHRCRGFLNLLTPGQNLPEEGKYYLKSGSTTKKPSRTEAEDEINKKMMPAMAAIVNKMK